MWRKTTLPRIQQQALCERCGKPLFEEKSIYAYVSHPEKTEQKKGNPLNIGYIHGVFRCQQCFKELYI